MSRAAAIFALTFAAILAVPLAGTFSAPEAVTATKPADCSCWCPVAVKRVIDADTVVADVYLPWDVCLIEQHLRVDSYDAHETTKRRQSEAAGIIDDAEVERGLKAKVELERQLETWTLWVRPGVKPRDNYGRLLGPWKFVKGHAEKSGQELAAEKGWIRK